MLSLFDNTLRELEGERLPRIRKALSEFNIRNAIERKLHRLKTFAKIGFTAPLMLVISVGRSPQDSVNLYLPDPLSQEDEEKYIRMLSDVHMKEKARSVLIEHNLRLVAYTARKFNNTSIGFEDLCQVGIIGLIKGVDSFDPEKKSKFATYASKCIENEILMYLRQERKHGYNAHLDDPLYTDPEGNKLAILDVLEGSFHVESDVIDSDTLDELRKVLNSPVLSPKEKTLIEMRYGLNEQTSKTQKEVSSILGISQSYISRLEQRIIRKLRDELEKTRFA